MIKIDNHTALAITEVIDNCADEQYVSNSGGSVNAIHEYKKLQLKFPYDDYKKIDHIDTEDIPLIVKGIQYMAIDRNDWDILQIAKSDAQLLINLLEGSKNEIASSDWLLNPM